MQNSGLTWRVQQLCNTTESRVLKVNVPPFYVSVVWKDTPVMQNCTQIITMDLSFKRQRNFPVGELLAAS